MRELQCNVLSGAGRKYLRGSRGTAALYVRRGFLPRLTPVRLEVQSVPWHARGLVSVVRASVHAFNQEDEIEQLVRAVERLSFQAP